MGRLQINQCKLFFHPMINSSTQRIKKMMSMHCSINKSSTKERHRKILDINKITRFLTQKQQNKIRAAHFRAMKEHSQGMFYHILILNVRTKNSSRVVWIHQQGAVKQSDNGNDIASFSTKIFTTLARRQSSH